MMIKKYSLLVGFTFVIVLSGCENNEMAQLKAYMEKVERESASNRIEEPIEFGSYQPFSYTGADKRSPFKQPMSIEDLMREAQARNVVPDESRPKEFLEQFDIESLQYVGLFGIDNEMWALVRDTEGKVHRLREGNYLGKNHGRIQSITEQQLTITEIVPNGLDTWIEIPRNIDLNTAGSAAGQTTQAKQ